MIAECTAFFRLNGNQPVCGGAFCPYVWNDEITCPIKPSKDAPRVLRKEGKDD